MKAVRVSIFINEADKWQGRPLHIQLLEALAKEGIAGATVVRGVAGYTKARGISTTSLVDAGGLLPLVVEFIDSAENVERMLPLITSMIGKRLVATSEVDVRYGGALDPK
jgi:PII-like signaling protein